MYILWHIQYPYLLKMSEETLLSFSLSVSVSLPLSLSVTNYRDPHMVMIQTVEIAETV